MLSLNALLKVFKKCICALISAARDRAKKSASSYYYIKTLYIHVLFFEEIKNDVLAEVLLIDDRSIGLNFLCAVAQCLLFYKSLILKNTNLG